MSQTSSANEELADLGKRLTDGLHPNLCALSNSLSHMLHKCPRKYQLYKLLPRQPGAETSFYRNDGQGDEHLDYGAAVGDGVQRYLISGDIQDTYFYMFLRWKKFIDDESGEKARKTFWHALFAIDKFITLRKTVLANYELAYIDGKPACELGFVIDCGGGFTYRGKIDVVMIHKMTKEIVVLEFKTTKFREVHEAVYRNSSQALGYSLIIDILVAALGLEATSSTKVIYPIYKTFAFEWEIQQFAKSNSQRAMWIKHILVDIQHIRDYVETGYFPMHGEACYDFFRPCAWLGVCEISDANLIPKEVAEVVVPEEDYPFRFNLDKIIENQLARVS